MPQGARIYNLFPLLAGTVSAWEKHLDRILRDAFDPEGDNVYELQG